MSTGDWLAVGLILATLVGAAVLVIQARTNVQVSAKAGTFYRPFNGAPYRAIEVVITNHSRHEVEVTDVALQYFRLIPIPGWRTFTRINPTFVTGTLGAKKKDEQYFEMDEMAGHARAEGWHRGVRLARARVEVTTIPSRTSPILITGLS